MENSKDILTESKYINLSLHYLEQVIISLRDEMRSKKRKENGRHIPYRNNVLTNILRDSLGGNSRSSFIINLSLEKYHFEESISSCRFGQRCGEVMVQYHANSEISLVDQIRNLYTKVREMDRDMQDLEREKSILEEELFLAREDLNKSTASRGLSEREINYLKEYPKRLTDYVDETVRLHSSAEYLDNLSHEDLRVELYGMDKAVLVDLSLLLGKELQVLHYGQARALADEEDRKKAEAARLLEEQRIEEQQAFEREQKRLEAEDMRRRELVQQMHEKKQRQAQQAALKKAAVECITTGDEFLKESRGFFGGKSKRFVFLSKDGVRLCWRKLKEADSKAKSLALSEIRRFDIARISVSIMMMQILNYC